MTRLPALVLISVALAGCHHGDDTRPEPSKQNRSIEKAVDKLLDGNWRTPASTARDPLRHPAPTLAFFAIEPNMTVLEIRPGDDGYADLLAPYLRKHGRYVAAVDYPASLGDERSRALATERNRSLRDAFAGNPKAYEAASVIEFTARAPELGPPQSVDVVLSVDDAHAWVAAGNDARMFEAIFEVLKPGGVFALIDARATDGTAQPARGGSALSEQQVIGLALKAGFRFDQRSDINAGAANDRMTLRFVKPAE
jgi:predicted methyltransferase